MFEDMKEAALEAGKGSRSRCPRCGAFAVHSAEVCAVRLAQALDHSERERKVAVATVRWLRSRLGEETDED